jgi:hypothetical protein
MDSIKVHQQPTAAPDKVQPDKQTALLVFPFEPHSLIMAALSRKQLLSAGFSVELLCYPDTIDGSAWLWGETLANMTPAEFRQLIVINDRAGADLRA